MIKFFRKIRQRFLLESKFSKYLLYAIGEILLVVIGILIALQINNANEQRKEKEELSKVYTSIIDELNSDIIRANQVIPVLEWQNKMIRRITNDELSDLQWIENDSVVRSFTYFPDFDIGRERYELLKQKSAISDSTRALNILIGDFYHKFKVDLDVRNTEMDESFKSDISYWREHEVWFGKYMKEGDRTELLKYKNENPLFINRILWRGLVQRRYESIIRKYRDEAKQLKTKIEIYLNE